MLALIKNNDRPVYVLLADLFFLDTEHRESFFVKAACKLRSLGWSKEATQSVLVELIAPVVGANLGYLVYPVIGAWDGFDEEELIQKIEKRIQGRNSWPKFFFIVQDCWARWALRKLEVNKLLNLME